MKEIKAIYGDQVKRSFVMGGLVENIDTFYDSHNNIGGPEMFEQGAAHWQETSGKHVQPVDIRVVHEMKGAFRSTYQASIVYKAAQIQNQSQADKFLRRTRETAAAERKLIYKVEVQAELAGDVQQPGFHCSQYGLSDRKAGQRLHLVLLLQCGYWDQRPDLFVRPKPGLLQSESQRGQDHRQCDTKAGGELHRCRILPAQLAAQGNVYGLVFDNRYLERCCKVITVCAWVRNQRELSGLHQSSF